MKLLIYLVLGYFAYRLFLQPKLNAPNKQDLFEPHHKKDDSGDYTDYEEVD